MTLRDELETVMKLRDSSYRHEHGLSGVVYDVAVDDLIRTHGPALLEALDGVVISRELANYLYGSGPLDGTWFGDHNPNKKPYWWRDELGKAIDRARGGGS